MLLNFLQSENQLQCRYILQTIDIQYYSWVIWSRLASYILLAYLFALSNCLVIDVALNWFQCLKCWYWLHCWPRKEVFHPSLAAPAQQEAFRLTKFVFVIVELENKYGHFPLCNINAKAHYCNALKNTLIAHKLWIFSTQLPWHLLHKTMTFKKKHSMGLYFQLFLCCFYTVQCFKMQYK